MCIRDRYEIIKRKIEKPVADEITKLKKDKGYKGIYLEVDTKRYYPYENLASTVIGFTNSDNQGAYGLEAKYNSVLSGTPGRKISAKNALGETLPTSYEKIYPAQQGNSIVTTIDQVIQHLSLIHIYERFGGKRKNHRRCPVGRTGHLFA